MEIQKNISDVACSFFIIQENKIAIAEINLYPKEMLTNYLEEVKANKTNIETVFQKTDKTYFFNRLNVPEKMRNQGLGALLLKEVLDFVASENGILVNTVNAYGDLSQKELINWYEKHGMTVGNKQGLLFYHSDLKPQNRPKQKLR